MGYNDDMQPASVYWLVLLACFWAFAFGVGVGVLVRR